MDGNLPLYCLRTPSLKINGGIYLSAGIHGDEAGGTEGLIAWAEKNASRLREIPALVFPCLNPWALQTNSRYDRNGLDLNRAFHLSDYPFVMGWRAVLGAYRFPAALALHEDYDAQGIYIYESYRAEPHWGEALLDAARPIIPIEQRAKVDGRKQSAGLVRRRINIPMFETMGYPESVWLHLHHAERTFTIETPSEFSLTQRVAAQVAVIEEGVRRLFGE